MISNLHEPLLALADCLCQTVAEDTLRPLCWCGLYPGDGAPFEYCSECETGKCGVGYVALQSAAPYVTFGLDGVDPAMRCGTPIQAQVRVGVMRCFPLEEDGSTPPPSLLSSTTVDLVADMSAIRRAVLCCFDGEARLESYSVLGPDGGCVGGEWVAWVGLEG